MNVSITINIGTIKVISMTTASTIAIGKSGVSNRNNSKSNTGPTTTTDGNVYMPVGTQVNYDPDHMDTPEWGGDNIVNASAL
ncbi:hypothetical protein [Effusibacillus dendaii]|uniref:Uncharacterized protein n=1 Tax=Effusibacillus dendaii TaxID=2743772 RepID=A0A7I8D954_9BACL|nr:hypothetical protein [Effusibacillus dendaii]BCJ86673.1 hypothetical protein skT53_16580 [Effusibacillus dendaii]